MCLKYYPDGSFKRANFFELSVKDGEGYAYGPNGSGSNSDNLHVKRVTNTAGDFTGLYLKSAPAIEPERLQRMRQVAEDISLQPVDRSLISGAEQNAND
ncbi:hypothetical protein [Diaphorobacter caeni]|uniref:hypothetical protein n=1 Tax=Diaphorobacter caeni TaxID=2784387 RepID=UPI00188E0066|nr:hypothetical protein [Diaphorobacter caeni]MBF5005266.1 hypothetical protein [Diaphorobacter caeni]